MQTNNTHDYTDEQLLTAFNSALSTRKVVILSCSADESYWSQDSVSNIALARAFLAALPKPGHCVESDQKANPHARLKAYSEAGAMIRAFDTAAGKWGIWVNKFSWDWTLPVNHYEVHPDDLHLCPEYAPKAAEPAPWTLPAEASAETLPIATLARDQVEATPEMLDAAESALRAEIGTNTQPADDGPPWIPHDGGLCPLRYEEVEEWEMKFRNGNIIAYETPPRSLRPYWWHDNHILDIIAYRVLKWKPGHGPQAASKAAEPAPAKPSHGWPYDDLLKSMDRPTPAQPWTPKPGDVVRLKSGGPSMTVRGEELTDCSYVAWFVDGQLHEDCLPNECLTPAKEGQP